MPKLTDIYSALMDDPDVIPPQDVTKEDYALMLAEQRIKQHENNEKALTLGLTKLIKNTNGHSNGTNGHSSSAVDQLSEFLFKADGINRAARRVLEDLGHSDVSIAQIVADLGPDQVPIRSKGKATVNERDIRDHIAMLNDGLVPTDDQRVTLEDHNIRMDNRSLQDAGYTQRMIDNMGDDQKNHNLERVAAGDTRADIEAAEAADEPTPEVEAPAEVPAEPEAPVEAPSSPTPEVETPEVELPTIESHSDIENLSNAQIVALARQHGNIGIGGVENPEEELNDSDTRRMIVGLLGDRMNLTPPAASTPEPDTSEPEESEQVVHDRMTANMSGNAKAEFSRTFTDKGFKQYTNKLNEQGGNLDGIRSVTHAQNHVDDLARNIDHPHAGIMDELLQDRDTKIAADIGHSGFQDYQERRASQGESPAETPTPVPAETPVETPVEEPSSSDEPAPAESASPAVSDLEQAHNAIRQHVEDQGGTFDPEHPDFAAEGIEDMEGANDWINDNENGGVFAPPEEDEAPEAPAEADHFTNLKDNLQRMQRQHNEGMLTDEQYNTNIQDALTESKETLGRYPTLEEAQTLFPDGQTLEEWASSAGLDYPAEGAAPAEDLPEMPEVNDENTRATDNKLRFGNTKAAIDTAKQYGLMHPNGTYTDLGHQFLDQIGDLYTESADQILSNKDQSNSYIRHIKNLGIQQRNERLHDAWSSKEDTDPEKGSEPTLENGMLKPERKNYKLTDKTLTNRTITHSTFVSLTNALNNQEGPHAAHEWTPSYNPETGAELEGLGDGGVPHTPNDFFNFDHFDHAESGKQKLTHALFANLIGDDLGILDHEAAWIAHQVSNAGGTPQLAAETANTAKENAITEDKDGNIEVDLSTVEGSHAEIETTLEGQEGITTPIMGNGNTPDFDTMLDVDVPAIQALRRISLGVKRRILTPDERLSPEARKRKDQLKYSEENGILDHILEDPEHQVEFMGDMDRLKEHLTNLPEKDFHKFMGTKAKAKVAADDKMQTKQAKETAANEAKQAKETATREKETGTRQARESDNTTAAKERQAVASAEEPSTVRGAMQRKKLMTRWAKLKGIDTTDEKAMADFNEEYNEDIYSHAEILAKFKADHALDSNGKSQKNTADKARADAAKLANAQIHLNSGRYPSHEEFQKKFEELHGRPPNEEETKASHTEHARGLLHYWHENKDSFVGTDAQNQFEEKIQDYLNNGADFKEISEDLQNMEAQGIDLGDTEARDKYYEDKSYKEKQPQLSEEHHAERLSSALTDGHHDRVSGMSFNTETGEPISGHRRLNEDGGMDIVPAEEAGRDGGEIEHTESADAPQLQHHKADGTLDEDAQALYQKVHEARQTMSRDDHAHVNALENENSEHANRIEADQATHDSSVEASEQKYQDDKSQLDETRKGYEERATSKHAEALTEHTQKHEEWDNDITGHEDSHAQEEQRFADTESKIHGNHEKEMGKWDDWAANVHESWEGERKAIPQKYAEQRTELQDTHEEQRTERQERHDKELQDARDTFESELRDSPDFKDLSEDDPMYQQEIQRQTQALQEGHEQEYGEETTRQREEQTDLDQEQDNEEKAADEWHNKIDERRDHEQRMVGNDTADALQQNGDTNQEHHDGIVSSINERREERGDPQITEGLTRGQRAGAGADGASILAQERDFHDTSHEEGVQDLQNRRDGVLRNIRKEGERIHHTLKKDRTQRNHEATTEFSSRKKASDQQRVAKRAKLEADSPTTKAKSYADALVAGEDFRDHMGKVESVRDDEKYEADDPEGDLPENMIQRGTDEEGGKRASAALQHPELGATSEKKKEAHEDDQEGEDREGNKGQTRMVEDPTTGEQKQQVWIPGRGKGWVDKDKMNDATGSNADAANDKSGHEDGKVVIYPPGHFDAGTGPEIGEDHDEYRAPSQAMVGHGGNLYAVADKHIDPDDPAVAAMGHDDYIANHLAGVLGANHADGTYNTLGGETYSGLNAADLGLNTGDHPATKSAGKRAREGLGAKFREGKEEGEKATSESALARLARKVITPDQQRRAGSLSEQLKAATKPFSGAGDYLASKGIGQGAAEALRSERHATERLGSKYPTRGFRGYSPKENLKHKASLGDELWRLTPRKLRPRSVQMRHSIEDHHEVESATKALSDHVSREAAKVESRRTKED